MERLDADYRGAFDEWAVQVSRFQEGAGSACKEAPAVMEAAQRVAIAESDYRLMRNRLSDNLSTKTGAE